jgi:excisionase family DNA binding protein
MKQVHERNGPVTNSGIGFERPACDTVTADSAGEGRAAPLVVAPQQACQILCVGLTRLYELLHQGELQSYRHGRSRRITTASIRAYIERQVEASPSTWGPPP